MRDARRCWITGCGRSEYIAISVSVRVVRCVGIEEESSACLSNRRVWLALVLFHTNAPRKIRHSRAKRERDRSRNPRKRVAWEEKLTPDEYEISNERSEPLVLVCPSIEPLGRWRVRGVVGRALRRVVRVQGQCRVELYLGTSHVECRAVRYPVCIPMGSKQYRCVWRRQE